MSPRHDLWDLGGRAPNAEGIPSSWPASSRAEVFEELPYTELRGSGDTLVRFLEPLLPTLNRDAEGYLFALDALGVREHGTSWEEARRRAADRLARDVDRLTRAFADELTEVEREQRSRLLAHVDLLGGEIGIDFPADRWLVGHIQGSLFVPVQDDFAAIPIPAELRGVAEPGTLCMSRVAIYRDGTPRGEVLEIEPAGSGGSSDEEP